MSPFALRRAWLNSWLCAASFALLSCSHAEVQDPNAPGPGTGGDIGAAGTSGSPSLGGTDSAGSGTAAGDTGVGGTSNAGSTSAGAPAGGTTNGGSSSGGSGVAGGSAGSQSGGNLIGNGDFSSGDTNWHVEGNTTSGVMNGQFCLMLAENQMILVGWPSGNAPASLMSGVSYRISFQASSSGPLPVNLHLKVGRAVEPFTADFESDETLGASLMTYMRTFTLNAPDDMAGVAFTFASQAGSGQTSTACLDNVTLTAN